MNRYVVFSILLGLGGGACDPSDAPQQLANQDQGHLAEQLRSLGFDEDPAAFLPEAGGPEGETAVLYQSADGRSGLLVENEEGVERGAIIFDQDGQLQSRLEAEQDVAYEGDNWVCLDQCWAGYYACVFSCWWWGESFWPDESCWNACAYNYQYCTLYNCLGW